MAKFNESGIGHIAILLVVVLLVVIGGVGGYVYSQNKNKPVASKEDTDPPFEDTPTGFGKDNEPNSATANWLKYTSTKESYSVNIPDGWDLGHLEDTENLYSKGGDINYEAGTKATVKELQGGWDGPSAFSLYGPSPYNKDEIVKEGTKQGSVTTDGGLVAEKYIYTQEANAEGIGYTKGDKVYNYYFGADGDYIQFQHVVSGGGTDAHDMVEQMLKTLTVKKSL